MSQLSDLISEKFLCGFKREKTWISTTTHLSYMLPVFLCTPCWFQQKHFYHKYLSLKNIFNLKYLSIRLWWRIYFTFRAAGSHYTADYVYSWNNKFLDVAICILSQIKPIIWVSFCPKLEETWGWWKTQWTTKSSWTINIENLIVDCCWK